MDHIIERRLGFKYPRSVLLPPYLRLSPYFEEFTDIIDEVYDSLVDNKIHVLENLRNMWVTNPALEQAVLEGRLINFDEWSQPERELLVQQVNMLGMKLQSAGVLSNDAYHTLSRFLGEYWFEKGTYNFIEFINFCVGSDLRVYRLWSQNDVPGEYSNMTQEDENGNPPGLPVWEGGEWFPTTHVVIESRGNLLNLDVHTLTEFFYEIANYNLVLESIDTSIDLPFVADLEESEGKAEIVAMGLFLDPMVVLSNTAQFGGDGPDHVEFENGALPTTCYAVAGATPTVLLAEPTGWLLDTEGRSIPIYSPEHMQENASSSIPTALHSGPSTTVEGDTRGYALVVGPMSWLPIPGSSRSPARIPAFSTTPTLKTDANSISANVVGLRNAYLANPRGWFEISPGNIVPYW